MEYVHCKSLEEKMDKENCSNLAKGWKGKRRKKGRKKGRKKMRT